jgi:hypothetical protein
MALSKCPKCNNGFFELKSFEPRGARYKQNFIQCSMCGTPVGVVGFYDAGSLIKEQEEEIAELQKRLKVVEAYCRNIDQNLVKISRSMR